MVRRFIPLLCLLAACNPAEEKQQEVSLKLSGMHVDEANVRCRLDRYTKTFGNRDTVLSMVGGYVVLTADQGRVLLWRYDELIIVHEKMRRYQPEAKKIDCRYEVIDSNLVAVGMFRKAMQELVEKRVPFTRRDTTGQRVFPIRIAYKAADRADSLNVDFELYRTISDRRRPFISRSCWIALMRL
jgi:hypothetical protein